MNSDSDITPYRRLFALVGFFTGSFGVAALLWPRVTLQLFLVLFATSALMYSLIGIVIGIRDMQADESEGETYLLFGVLSALTGIAILVWPDIFLSFLLVFVALSFILLGICQVFGAEQLHHVLRYIPNIIIMISGWIELLIGVFILVHLQSSAAIFIGLLGISCIISGVLAVGMAVFIRRWLPLVERYLHSS